ncbi:hypothetical protein [Oscillibacter sp.]|uniref:hypothetical protein n=1 Tax=Oscillibacter sp. TaxID=1945593 RepID=UPI002D80466E|nr:hypothetical protein [Oscillibacter sp.]
MADRPRHAAARPKKAVNFLTIPAENGNKMTKIWGIDKPVKLSYPEKDERAPKQN